MRHYFVLGIVLALPACGRTVEAPRSGHAELPPVEAGGLRPVSDFETITDPTARSAAMFLEASRVLTHPRCLNCHPAGDTPLQGESMMVHEPPVTRGVGNRGVVGMECTSCHQDENLELARVPGAPDWHLAPIQAAWVGRSPRQICEQLKDPKLNGKRTLEAYQPAIRAIIVERARIYHADPLLAVHSAHADMQLAAFALTQGDADLAIALADGALPHAAEAENAALLATLLAIKAEALTLQGRDDAARSTRLDSLGWARYGFGPDKEVRRQIDEIAALSPLNRSRPR